MASVARLTRLGAADVGWEANGLHAAAFALAHYFIKRSGDDHPTREEDLCLAAANILDYAIYPKQQRPPSALLPSGVMADAAASLRRRIGSSQHVRRIVESVQVEAAKTSAPTAQAPVAVAVALTTTVPGVEVAT